MNKMIESLSAKEPMLWINPQYRGAAALNELELQFHDILDAEARLYRFAPLLGDLFEEAAPAHGIIESELLDIPELQQQLMAEAEIDAGDGGRLLIKGDHNLPVAGSIKARGGIYAVLRYAETLALKHELIDYSDNYRKLGEKKAREFFSRYTISVGSTGNLGLSIGIISAGLGFTVKIHMSADAKAWKKALLRSHGVTVVEHTGDYGAAVEQGRKEAEGNPYAFFVDDENSVDLFLGYAVAALRLKNQLIARGITVDEQHPLMVYLPCGVGGAPGGITFGLKHVFGDAVHCFFAEPVESPCMTLGLMTGKHDEISVYDIGLSNRTIADGLAVARPSAFVGKMIQGIISGTFTVTDARLEENAGLARTLEKLKLEPSATAGFQGPQWLLQTEPGRDYLRRHGLESAKLTHILWTTGGRYLPE